VYIMVEDDIAIEGRAINTQTREGGRGSAAGFGGGEVDGDSSRGDRCLVVVPYQRTVSGMTGRVLGSADDSASSAA